MTDKGPSNADQIRERAFRLWQEDGCPEGRSMDYWFRAELELAGEASSDANRDDPVDTPAAMDEPSTAPRTRRRQAKPAGEGASDAAEAGATKRRPRSKAGG